MAFKVEVTEIARQDMQDYHDYIVERERSLIPGRKWYSSVAAELRALKDFPESRPLIPEADLLDIRLREAFSHSHRIVFSVDEKTKTVYVLRVYHSSRRPLGSSDLPDLE